MLLIGILSNYNKFEFRNPYRIRLEDFVNQAIIRDFVEAFGALMAKVRDGYVVIQDDIAEGWTLSNTLAYIGLGMLAPAKPTKETTKVNAHDPRSDFGDL